MSLPALPGVLGGRHPPAQKTWQSWQTHFVLRLAFWVHVLSEKLVRPAIRNFGNRFQKSVAARPAKKSALVRPSSPAISHGEVWRTRKNFSNSSGNGRNRIVRYPRLC